jgi:hypothetical protein
MMMSTTTTEQPWPKSKHANDGLSKYGPPTLNPRDLMGYGGNTPHFKWPNKGHAKVALNFCIHYEAGGMYDVYCLFFSCGVVYGCCCILLSVCCGATSGVVCPYYTLYVISHMLLFVMLLFDMFITT